MREKISLDLDLVDRLLALVDLDLKLPLDIRCCFTSQNNNLITCSYAYKTSLYLDISDNYITYRRDFLIQYFSILGLCYVIYCPE